MTLFIFLLWLLSAVNIFRIAIMKQRGQEVIGWVMFQIITLLLQIRFDGFTWQTTGLYVLPLIWLVYYKLKNGKILAYLMMVLFVVTSLLLIVFPAPELDRPSGQYEIGTTKMYFIDEARDRELPSQIWYPSLNNQGKSPENWFEDQALIDAFAEVFHMRPFMMAQLKNVKSHSYPDLDLIEGQHPVIIVSHGWSSFKKIHLNLIEELASHGYIVVALDHTGASAMTILHTGQVVKRYDHLLDFDDLLTGGKQLLDTFEDDISFVVNQLTVINQNHRILHNKMDLDNLGVLGHSTGGGALVQFASNRDVKALIAMDAWVEPIETVKALGTACLFMRSQEWAEGDNNINLKKMTTKVYQPEHSKHQDFTLAFKFSPMLEILGYTSGASRQDQEDLVVKFFDKHLRHLNRDYEHMLIDIN